MTHNPAILDLCIEGNGAAKAVRDNAIRRLVLSRLEQIVNMKQGRVQLAGKIDRA